MESWLADDENRCFLFAEIEEHSVGVIMAQTRQTPDIPIVHPRQYVFIDTLVTDTAYQRRGVATALVDAIHQWGNEKGIQEFQLGVLAFNTGAIQLYEKIGYTVLQQRMVFWTKE